MAFALLFLVFIGTFIYSIVRSKSKLKTVLYTFAAMAISICVSIAIVILVFKHQGLSSHDSGYVAGFTAGPVASIAGIITSLIHSGKTKRLHLGAAA